MALFSIDAGLWLEYLAKITIAFVLALPVAWDREHRTRIMGLRTFPLVSIGTCAYVLVAQSFMEPGSADAQARVVQGLVGGIGFIGGGAILKDGDRVMGTASAASIWITGAMGAAIAWDNLEVAVTLSVVNLLVLKFLTPLKEPENAD